MKKFAKMSLVAAVAVAGLSTTSSAKALEEAIQNVDVSGTVVYRYDDRSFDGAGDVSNNNYKIGLTLKSQVNDDVTAVTRFIVGGADNGFATMNYVNDGDGQANVALSNVYFSYTGISNTTVNVGKQGLTTPWTVAIDADGNEQTGTGILALTNVGPVTLAAAYFNQTNLDNGGDKNVMTIGAMGNLGPVSLDGWYLDRQDVYDTYTVGAKANFEVDEFKFAIGARHTALEEENSKTDNSLTKIEAGMKFGIFGMNLGYGWTDEEGGLAAEDNDALTGFQGWILDLNKVADASLLKISADAQVLPSLNISLNYNELEKDATDTKDTELYLQATYQMSKNFGGYIRFGKAEFEKDYVSHSGKTKDNDGTIGRLQVQYSF